MSKGMLMLGYILIVVGVLSAIFTAVLYLNNFNLMEHLPASDQYLMAAVLAILFISIGIMMVKQESNN
jgi:hypothetical protein